jgi:hypothetical protein
MRPMRRRTFLQTSGGLAATALSYGASTQRHGYRTDTAGKDLHASQLFLDDTWIEETYRLERVWDSAEIYPEPVLKPEKPWESHELIMFGSVFRDRNEWRMYYGCHNMPAPTLCCLAYSRDGIHWERPNLGLFEFQGSKANNIVLAPPPGEDNDGATVCHDPQDANAPYKMMFYGHGKLKGGQYVAFSKDGIVWERQPGPVLITGDRTNVMASRDRRGKFVAYLRHRNMMRLHRGRSVWRSESDDFKHWTEPEPVLRQDLLEDPNTELYGMAVFPYADFYMGMLERWYDNPDVIEVQPAWSYDGQAWHRPEKRTAFIAPTYSWNKAWSSCANTAPIREGNQLCFFFGARSTAHGSEFPQPFGSIGLASMTVDRFAAIRGDFKEGLLLTRPMTWPGGDLLLNSTNTRYPRAHPTSGSGKLLVEVLDEGNQPIPGFSGDKRADFSVPSPVPMDREDRPVLWANGKSLRELAGKRIRLAFYLQDSRLYSFRASTAKQA